MSRSVRGGSVLGILDAKIRNAIGEDLFAGAVLRVERGHGGGAGLLFEAAWGEALRTASAKVPMAVDTIFDIASITKIFTATAVLRLATTGRIGLDARLGSIPGLFDAGKDPKLHSALSAAIGSKNLSSLLSHSSGIHYWYPFYARRGESFEAILAEILAAHPPREETVYSDLNFMLLGRVIEALTGKSVDVAVGELVLAPLGLSRSSWRAPRGAVAATEFGNRIEEGMVAELGLSFDGWRDRERPITGEPDDGNCHYFFGDAAGHAGLFSDARDLCRLGRLYLDGGRVDGEAFLDPRIVAEASRDHGAGRGLGFQLGDNYPGGGFGHTGFTGSYLHVNAKSGLVIVLLANRLHVEAPRDLNPFRREISEIALSLFGQAEGSGRAS